ncbi:hypothetical protein [Salinibacillus xinjiangensis]|uniref:Amyloid fiber anchoring/assembly protein TapA n=1 Tax=Salinibacillus xinjiangensis TaxID=1229268 RepID=A0A6G1X267_9BACI|nr:hypothetical protein [Salinibacillus xinjiangensis]MRG85029.1 hypothetical protein [Salinibacillus xinjiangensis]
MRSRLKKIHNRQLRKFMKRQRTLASSFKLLGFWSVIIIIATMLTTGTGALVNDIEKSQGSIHVEWDDTGLWDKSSLEFIGQSGSCEVIQATITNGKDSEPMAGTVAFEVYYVEKGKIKDGKGIYGEKIFTGEVPALDTGEKTVIKAEPTKGDGKYMFRAFQRPGHNGKGELWSGEVVLSGCNAEQQTESEKASQGEENPQEKENNVDDGKASENSKGKSKDNQGDESKDNEDATNEDKESSGEQGAGAEDEQNVKKEASENENVDEEIDTENAEEEQQTKEEKQSEEVNASEEKEDQES